MTVHCIRTGSVRAIQQHVEPGVLHMSDMVFAADVTNSSLWDAMNSCKIDHLGMVGVQASFIVSHLSVFAGL